MTGVQTCALPISIQLYDPRAAHALGEVLIGRADDQAFDTRISRRGFGGKVRAENMTDKQRSEAAREGATGPLGACKRRMVATVLSRATMEVRGRS